MPEPPLSHPVSKIGAPGQVGTPITVDVSFNGSDEIAMTIYKDETAEQLKLRLFEQDLSLPPPSAQRLNFGGIELPEDATFHSADVTEGAVQTLALTVSINCQLANNTSPQQQPQCSHRKVNSQCSSS